MPVKSLNFNVNERFSLVYYAEIEYGYANKMYGLLYAMQVALLTDSILLIEWENIQKFIQPPFHADSFNYKLIDFKTFDYTLLSYKTNQTWKMNKSLHEIQKSKIPDPNKTNNQFVYVVYSNAAQFFDISSNKIYHKKLIDLNLVNQSTVVNYESSLEKCLRIGFEVGHNLMNRFLRLRPEFQKEIDDFLNEKMFNEYLIFGIQIRMKYLNNNSDYIKWFAQCALSIENRTDVMSLKKKGVKWFVTSDQEWAIHELEKLFPDKIFYGIGHLAHVSEDVNGYKRTLFDSEILSRSNEIIITGSSTFGFLSALKKGIMPFYVNVFNFNQCERMNLSWPAHNVFGPAVF